jgi:hypothetical protein
MKPAGLVPIGDSRFSFSEAVRIADAEEQGGNAAERPVMVRHKVDDPPAPLHGFPITCPARPEQRASGIGFHYGDGAPGCGHLHPWGPFACSEQLSVRLAHAGDDDADLRPCHVMMMLAACLRLLA